MAQRPIWRGHLRLALVSCPVALYNARHEREALHFHLINPDTGNRIRMITQDAETGAELRRGDLAKGYEYKKDHFLVLDDEDFERARTESSTVMKVDKFIDAGSIDPIFYDSSYYMAPDGRAADDVYGVLRQAMAETGKVALTRVVIARRERAILVMPMEGGLVAHTLFEERDLNAAETVFEGVTEQKTDPEMVKLARQLIERQAGTYDPADVEDRYETRLRAVIDAKLEGQGVEPAAPAEEPDNVVDLMAALRKSLGQTSSAAPAKPKRGPVKAAPAKTPRKRA